jgi:uncharacterized lipoprotein YddW (UPF0748 family)
LIYDITAETPAPAEEKRLSTWRTDALDDLVLDLKHVTDALKKKVRR